MLAQQVEGRVATELDPRLAHDKGARGPGLAGQRRAAVAPAPGALFAPAHPLSAIPGLLAAGAAPLKAGISGLLHDARRCRPGSGQQARRWRARARARAPTLRQEMPPPPPPPSPPALTPDRNCRLAGALVARARSLLVLYQEMGVAPSKLIFRVPATWAGIQAAGELEREGVATQAFHVYRCAQVGAWPCFTMCWQNERVSNRPPARFSSAPHRGAGCARSGGRPVGVFFGGRGAGPPRAPACGGGK
jgi:hypothetical protein